MAKLCNQLAHGSQTTEITVEFGPSDNPIRLSALTATCSPPVGMPCLPIPTGAIPYRMMEGTKELDRGILPVRPGDELLLFATLNATSGAPNIIGGPLKPTDKCSDIYFEPDPPPTMSVRP